MPRILTRPGHRGMPYRVACKRTFRPCAKGRDRSPPGCPPPCTRRPEAERQKTTHGGRNGWVLERPVLGCRVAVPNGRDGRIAERLVCQPNQSSSSNATLGRSAPVLGWQKRFGACARWQQSFLRPKARNTRPAPQEPRASTASHAGWGPPGNKPKGIGSERSSIDRGTDRRRRQRVAPTSRTPTEFGSSGGSVRAGRPR